MNSHHRNRSGFPAARRRGSVLIVALIFALGIAISLGSFLQLANGATKLSYRTHYLGVAMNIAETGLEQAMWEINNPAKTWTGWTSPGPAGAHRNTYDLGKVEGGATAVVKVYAQEKTGNPPAWIVARAIITPPQGAPIEKWVKVTLEKRSRGAIGGLGRDGIAASGNQVVMGSWDSDPDNNPLTPPIPYSETVAKDNMALATTAFDATLNAGNADVHGKAAVGSDSTDAIQVGAQGLIGPFGTPVGTKDPNSISANFSADLPLVEAPSGSYTDLGTINAGKTLPQPGDTPNADGVYYYSATEISLNGAALAISPGYQVVMKLSKPTGTSISLSGNGGAIKVNSSLITNTTTGDTTYTPSQLKIYTSGDISMTGQASATNVINTQSYSASSTTTTTTISNVESIYGKGQEKNTVIGWSYTQTTIHTTTTTTNTPEGTTTTSTSSTPPLISKYKVLIESGATEPIAGTTTSTTAAGTYKDTGSYVGQAINLQIYGTRDEEDLEDFGAQTIKIAGNGNLSAVVYAPNANIEAKGGGNSGFVYGSLIGKSLKFTGNDCFYYDESLGRSDEGARLGIEDWTEMVSYADRATYGSFMNF